MHDTTKHPAPVTPRQLRAKAGVLPREMASRLGVTFEDVRTLEALDAELWEIKTLREYLAALDLKIHVEAVSRDGAFTLF